MKKCILLFALLVLSLITAVLLENENEIVQKTNLELGNNYVEKNSLAENESF